MILSTLSFYLMKTGMELMVLSLITAVVLFSLNRIWDEIVVFFVGLVWNFGLIFITN